ncbi:MAG TPA: polysaccharide deacetylase family protein [Acidimicrobiia bacterium]
MILAYHRVNREVRDGLSVSPSTLDDQLRHLVDAGWRNVVLDEHVDDLGPLRDSRSFAVTFDDGYQDNYIHAAPILEELGVRATVYLVSSYIDSGTPFPWVRPHTSSGHYDAEDLHLRSDQLEDAMSRGVFTYGSHTMTHPRLSALGADRATEEIAGSKEALQSRIGGEIKTFCYPAGDFNDETREIVASAGYRAAVVTPNRAIPETDLTLHRVGIYSHITPNLFRVKISRAVRSAAGSATYWRLRRSLSARKTRSTDRVEAAGPGDAR